MRKFIMNLDGSKATAVGDIPTDMLKQTRETINVSTIAIIHYFS